MPMGIVSPDELEAELNRLNSNANSVAETARVKEMIRRGQNGGRGVGDNNIPESLRKIIAEDSIVTPSNEIQAAFPVSSSSISAYKNGANSCSTYHQPAPELKNHVKTVKEKISNRASKKLFRALDAIDEDALKLIGKDKPQIASAVARDLAQIVRQMDDNDEDGEKNVTNNVVFYTPPMRDLKDFEVIDVN